MELKSNKIPEEFRTVIPRGLRLVHRNEQEFLLVESIFCPRGHNLLVDSVHIHGEPSIKLELIINGQKGLAFIDAFWGSHAKLFSFLPECSDGTMLEGFCPYCHTPLMEDFECHDDDCGSHIGLALHLPGGSGKVIVCSSLGCPGHILEVGAIPHELTESVSGINFFGAGTEEIFGGLE